MAALLEQGDWKGTFRRQSECDIYIYIYIFREREGEGDRERGRGTDREPLPRPTRHLLQIQRKKKRVAWRRLSVRAPERRSRRRERACPRMPSLERNLTGNYHRQGNYIASGFNSCSAVALITEVLGCCSHFLDLGCCSHLR